MNVLSTSPTSETNSTTSFIDRLESFGNAPAIFDTGRGVTSYSTLLDRANSLASELGNTRRLVFVEAAQTVDAIAAYVACLRARHPVYLYNSHDRPTLERLIERYRPNAIISAELQRSELTWLHQGTIGFHPDLAVLLSTSGSTGSSKLVKLSLRNIDANAGSIATYLSLNDSERAMMTLPYNHAYGMSVVNSHLGCGGALVLTNDSVIDREFWLAFDACGATSFAGVPYSFESIHRSQLALHERKTLRYATQAGGRLDPALVSYFAGLSAAQGWRFFVMYGQTEAGPRMAYLPPEQAVAHPQCIGVPIPGGHLRILDDQGREVTEVNGLGQLAYSGPNVMMGYAEQPEALATDDTPERLLTGDIAGRNAAGLFYIVGRTARFVKPFGIRVNLDDLESLLQVDLPGARCAGNDQQIVVAVTTTQQGASVAAVAKLARALKLPAAVFQVVPFAEMPRLPTGKIDYSRIVATKTSDGTRPAPRRIGAAAALSLVFSRRFARQYAVEVADALGLRARQWQSVGHIYQTLLATPSVQESDTFKSLAGDSLSYVQASAALTHYMGALPADWPERTVGELEAARLDQHGSIL
jgi:acyl-CoA synthetase (AMP-forming)/AMP-acid ligase II